MCDFMMRNRSFINTLDDKIVKNWLIIESHGFGTMEEPQFDGKTLQALEGTEFEAYCVAEGLNITLNGTVSKRSSWEDPTIHYRLQ